ncbi:MAG: twitching motility protein PilT [Lachnospiraceae bacterium]|nr:twitching motility protein PilT [Lachnospiraceae bacterium]
MVQLIVGNKGKGKTKHLLDKVNTEIKDVQGNVVYLDKSTKHMFELNNKIRLIDVSDYLVTNSDEFIGFICGIISQDHDLQHMYFDSFLKIACLDESDISATIDKLETISTKFHVDFVLSISVDEHALPDNLKSKVIVSL